MSVIDLYNKLKNNSDNEIQTLTKAFGAKFEKKDISLDDIVQTINQGSKNPQFYENFKNRLVGKFGEKAEKLKRFTKQEVEKVTAKFADEEHVVANIANKAVIGDAIQTNVLPVIGSLLYDTPLLTKIDRISSSRNHEIIEKETKLEKPATGNELASATLRKIVNRSKETLSPNNKLAVAVEVSESAESASDLAYLLNIILEDLIFANQEAVENQVLNGDDTGNNFRGLNVIVGSGNDRRGYIPVDTSGGANSYDALWLLWKGRNKQNRRKMGEDSFIMNENTKDAIVESKLTDNTYLAWLKDFMSGGNTITMPDGKKVEVVLVPDDMLGDGKVLLGPLKMYKLIVSSDFALASDLGYSNFLTDITTYKSTFKGDGGYHKSFTYKLGTTDFNFKENPWRKSENVII